MYLFGKVLTINYDVVAVVVIDLAFTERHYDQLAPPLAGRFEQPDDCLPHPVCDRHPHNPRPRHCPTTLVLRGYAMQRRYWLRR